MLAIFTYGLPEAELAMAENKCELITLSNYEILLETALSEQRISQSELEILAKWRHNPYAW